MKNEGLQVFFKAFYKTIIRLSPLLIIFILYLSFTVEYVEDDLWEYDEEYFNTFINPEQAEKYYEILKEAYDNTEYHKPLDSSITQWRG